MTPDQDDDAMEREAQRQGASDGRNGYPLDPGDFTGRHRAAYERAFRQARHAAGGMADHPWEPGAFGTCRRCGTHPDTPFTREQHPSN